MAFEISEFLARQIETVAQIKAGFDSQPSSTDDGRMTTPTKDEMKSALEASEARVDARLANFDTSVKTGFADLRTDFADLRTEMQKMRADMHKDVVDIVKWGAGIAFAAVASTVGLLTLINKAADKPPGMPTQAQPIVIYAQPAQSIGEVRAAPSPK